MAQLKQSVINLIYIHLELEDFCAADFDANFSDDTKQLAKLTFRAKPAYTFIIGEASESGFLALMATPRERGKKGFETIERPGDYKNVEVKNHDDINACIGRIGNWLKNIRDDLASGMNNFDTEFVEAAQNLFAEAAASESDPAGYFNSDERKEMAKKLDELQIRVKDLEAKFNITPEEQQAFEKAISKSKADLSVYPREVWWKTTSTKIWNAMVMIAKSKEGRDLLVSVVKKFWLER
ncbi:hypothetical protein [Herbaspirillum sp. NPDC087042]|uniref:hypothetical protein n=1 Tax=Herbaspirillum sp. NPDC087042 TaxID=3364004 RepID=UPI0037FEEE5E